MKPLNINEIGPGSWYLLHLLAINASTEEEIKAVHVLIDMIASHFFCHRCRFHFKENREIFSPPQVNKYHELFFWTVEMHNKVNDLNGKSRVSGKEALNFYLGVESNCEGDCGSSDKKPSISYNFLDILTKGDSSKYDYTCKHDDL